MTEEGGSLIENAQLWSSNAGTVECPLGFKDLNSSDFFTAEECQGHTHTYVSSAFLGHPSAAALSFLMLAT